MRERFHIYQEEKCPRSDELCIRSEHLDMEGCVDPEQVTEGLQVDAARRT